MNETTLNYVRQHADDDVRKLALQGVKDTDVDLTQALQQIAGRQTARRKLPSWAAVEGIVYPPHLNMEQCSSEQTARYKAKIVNGKSVNGKWCHLYLVLAFLSVIITYFGVNFFLGGMHSYANG